MFLAKQSSDKPDRWVSANASFFRMHRILDIFFVGPSPSLCWLPQLQTELWQAHD